MVQGDGLQNRYSPVRIRFPPPILLKECPISTGPKLKAFACPEPAFWYLVGVIATDGCLVNNGRTVVVTSKHRDYLVQLSALLGVRQNVRQKRSGFGSLAYDLRIGSKDLYIKLSAIGVTPRKTATIGQLDVPDSGFKDFLRGVIDGDGNIRRWIHPTNGREPWVLRVFGISAPFLQWIAETTNRLWSVKGSLCSSRETERNRQTRHTLKYGKLAAKVILQQCYYSGAFALERKRRLAEACIAAEVGWRKSKTVQAFDSWRDWHYRHIWRAKEPSIAGLCRVVRDRHGAMLTELPG